MLAQTIPAARLVVLPNSGHTLNLEEPDAFNRLVGAFLGGVEPEPNGVRAAGCC